MGRFGESRMSLARGVILLVVFLVAMIVKFHWIEICGAFVGVALIVAALRSRGDRTSH